MSSADHERRDPSTTRYVRAGNVELQVICSGEGMPLFLVHGFPLEHSMWDAQIAQLSRRWRVVAPDLRGFGGSQVTAGTVTMEQMADDLAALVDALEIEDRIVFCGLSMGGYVALEFWRKHSSRLRGLVLCDTRAAPDSPEAAAIRLETAASVLRNGTADLADAMVSKLFAPNTLQENPTLAGIERQKIMTAPPEGVAAASRGMATRRDFRGELAKIALPTLVIVGEHDTISTVDEMRSIAKSIPDAEFVIIRGAGHMTPLEDPDGFNEAIEQFLTRVERAG